MDQIVVDVSDIPNVQAGDIATLLGTDGGETITAGELAALIPTTPHAITTGLTARVGRVQ
jgi:alanine racemase